ncbi:hypothetical protein RHMOL_Rhmol05G0178200 [Rhododendron molle]|uniref:Uncharacterized protein n=1 Tax=Rhododendron molle TaxID=49168 RepID=A0ACC0NRT0_RHOML|nr:hypothetical protein RHMOL_Rhmol05G0178200 [Rhododendron molle]
MAKPRFIFDSMENDEDMKRGLAAIESESENVHWRYQQLLGFKKPLLKIVLSIGENKILSAKGFCAANDGLFALTFIKILMAQLHHPDFGYPDHQTIAMAVLLHSLHCLEILQVLSKRPNSKKQLVSAGILSELFENNIHQGPKTARVQARAALCAFSEGDIDLVAELNSLIQKKVLYCLEHHLSMDIALATHEELLLLSEVCSLADEFWESRLRVVFQLFSAIKFGAKHPAISEHVILPCLRIIAQACTPPKPDTTDKEPGMGKPPFIR